MKRNLIYLLPLLIVYITGCSDKPVIVPIPPHPSGNFTGTFTRYHITVSTQKIDTLRANITLSLNTNGTYAVAGDTTTVHAGSFGAYSMGYGDDLVFTDKTLPATGTPAKQHLSGDYLYSYNGTTLQLLRGVGDTLSYQYSFNKSN